MDPVQGQFRRKVLLLVELGRHIDVVPAADVVVHLGKGLPPVFVGGFVKGLVDVGRIDGRQRQVDGGNASFRVALAFLCEAYDEEHLTDSKGKEDIRTVLRLHPALAPYKCAVLPLSKKLGEKAMEIRNELSKYFMVDYDDTGSIGKRYRREDEIGTPFCITVDFDTVGDEAKGIAADNCVTVRDRDTMEQVRMPISELKSYIESKIEF